VSLATQKFVADVANDALQYCKIRQQSPAYRDKRQGKGKRLILTQDDLSLALEAYGVTVKKPEYFVDPTTKETASPPSEPENAAGPTPKRQKQS